MKSIMESTHQQMRAIQDNQSLSQQDKDAKIQQLHESTKSQVNAMLTPDQQQKFAQIHEHMERAVMDEGIARRSKWTAREERKRLSVRQTSECFEAISDASWESAWRRFSPFSFGDYFFGGDAELAAVFVLAWLFAGITASPARG